MMSSARRALHLCYVIVCAREPADFAAVREWQENFQQTSDAEVHELLQQSRNLRSEKDRIDQDKRR